MENQVFQLTIDAESPDGRSIKSHISARVACDRSMGVSLMLKLIQHDPSFKEMIAEALLLHVTGEKITESISEDEYESNKRDPEL